MLPPSSPARPQCSSAPHSCVLRIPATKLAELISRPLVKVCGLTRQDDVDVAVEAGADLVGFILARESPRRTDELLDLPTRSFAVAVFVGEAQDTVPT